MTTETNDRVKALDFELFRIHQFQSSRPWPDGSQPTAPNWNPGCACGASHYYFEHPRHLAEVTAEYVSLGPPVADLDPDDVRVWLADQLARRERISAMRTAYRAKAGSRHRA